MISALAPWYGCKRTLAPRIVAALGKHKAYWEPFCGSCAVLFCKPQVSFEAVNDLHADLINLARVLQREEMALALYAAVSRTLFHEDLLPTAKAALLDQAPAWPDVERAYQYLLFSWMGLNGISGTPLSSTGTFAVRYSAKGGNGATRWASVAESIPEWHERLRGVQILSRDGLEILGRIDDAEGTAIYCDPPYLTKGSKYVHDFAPEDHRHLAEALGRFRQARVVVSYYADPRLADLYADWQVLECPTAKHMVQSGRRDQRGAVSAPEVLLVNQPLPEQASLFAAAGPLGPRTPTECTLEASP